MLHTTMNANRYKNCEQKRKKKYFYLNCDGWGFFPFVFQLEIIYKKCEGIIFSYVFDLVSKKKIFMKLQNIGKIDEMEVLESVCTSSED